MNIFLCKAMRVTVIMLSLQLTGPLLLIAGGSAAQSVTVNVRQVSITEVFQIIEKQAQVSFAYNKQTVSGLPLINLNLNSKSLDLALTAIGEKLPLEFQRRGNLIGVKRTEAAEQKVGLSTEIKPMLPDTVTITGKVTDDKGQPLPGATLRIEGTGRTITTDPNGAFRLTPVQDNATLVISYIGFKSKEVLINAGTTMLAIALEPNSSTLEEVIVSTGYQDVPLERATGSFSKIDNKTYNRQVSTDVISRLKAIAPSLLFDERGGQTRLAIRGRSTIFANDQPLIVVDNFPYEGNINTINPNDVESITILKDAAAASIWGVRAGNGVIVITTKKGMRNKPMSVEANSNLTLGEKPDLFYQPEINTSDFIDVESILFDKGFYNANINNTTNRPPLSPVVEILLQKRNGTITAAQADAQVNALRGRDVRNELLNHFYQTSINQQYAFNINGGSDKYNYYFSSGYDDNALSASGNQYKRISLNARQSFNPIKNLDFNTAVEFTKSNSNSNNVLSEIRMSPSQDIYPYAVLADESGNPLSITKNYRNSFTSSAQSQGLLDWTFKPLGELALDDSESSLSNFRIQTATSYRLPLGIKADLLYQYQNQTVGLRNLMGVESYQARDLINRFSAISGSSVTRNVPLGGILINDNTKLNAHNGRFQLGYNNNGERHSFNGLAGVEAREIRSDRYGSRYYGYDENIGSSVPVNNNTAYRLYPSGQFSVIPGQTNIDATVDRFRSYFSNLAYTYLDRYTLSASGRIDQSNLFGVKANQRAVPLWSVGGKWDIDKEPFYKIAWLPVLKFRATYGFNGNLDNTITAYTTASFTNSLFTQQTAASLRTPPNPEFGWEKTGMLNIGIDFGTQRGIISGSVEYFSKKGTDLIGTAPLDPTTGFTTYRGNVAETKGSGIDLQISTVNLNTAFRWNTNFLFSYVTDEVTGYEVKPTQLSSYLIDHSINRFSVSYTPIVGKPLFSIYSYKYAGLDPATGDPLGYVDGAVSKDYVALGSISKVPANELNYHGPALPPIFGAMRNTFGYKDWSLSVNLSYRFGHYFRRNSIIYNDLFQFHRGHADYVNRWQQPGDEQVTSVPSMVYPANLNRDLFYNRSD